MRRATFEAWLTQFFTGFGLPPKGELFSTTLKQFGKATDAGTANKTTHRRKIIPGDYKNNLSKNTIELLNQTFESVLTALKCPL
jgi:hypothetical protein